METKVADLLAELQPHQQAALERGLQNNLILAHSTGSGKTLTSLAIADAIGKPTICFTPASLVNNYNKEIAKHLSDGSNFSVYSLPTAVERNIPIPKGSTVIIDEAHALRNAGSRRYKYMKKQLPNAGRIIALTGTPAYNRVQDIGPLVNLVAQKNLLPTKPEAFANEYIKENIVRPSVADRIMGVQPGVVYGLKRKKKLAPILQKYVDVFDKEVEKPKTEYEDYYVPMTPEQEDVYQFVQEEIPSWLRAKLRANLPPSKREAKYLNTFLTGIRQVANTPEGYQEKDKTVGGKVKRMEEILRDAYNKDKNLRALVYSNFKDSGIDSIARLLDKDKIPYEKFHGELRPAQKKKIVERYNKGELPIILGTGSASEGLDLKKTNIIQLMEPHFNNARLEQVIGRGVRYKSHEGLPEDQRKVKIQRFYSRFPQSEIEKQLGINGKVTVDEYLRTRAEEKDRLIQEIKELFNRDASIDN